MGKKLIVLFAIVIITTLAFGCNAVDKKQNVDNKQETVKNESSTAPETSIPEKKETKVEDIKPSADKYKDGTYYGVGGGKETGMKITIEVKDNKISKVTVVEHNETKGYTDVAIEEIPKRIVAKNSTEVDVISRVTLTSEGVKYVVKNALKDAKIN